MSRAELPRPDERPLIALVDRAHRALQADMVRRAHADGHTEVKMAHNSVFGTLHAEGARAAEMATRAGITRQSMGEVIRDMVGLDLLEMREDPNDGRAKVVTYSEHGLEVAGDGFGYLIQLERRFAAEFGRRSTRWRVTYSPGSPPSWTATPPKPPKPTPRPPMQPEPTRPERRLGGSRLGRGRWGLVLVFGWGQGWVAGHRVEADGEAVRRVAGPR